MALPSNVSFGTVTGRFLLAIADTADIGAEPDSQPASGTVLFTPSINRAVNVSAVPPVTILPQSILCTLDVNGDLRDPVGNLGIMLVATDDVDLNPSGWTWGVSITIGSTVWGFDMAVEGGETHDISTVTTVPSSEGVLTPMSIVGVPDDDWPPAEPVSGVLYLHLAP